MTNEHTAYEGEIDVPAKAMQIIDPNIIASLPTGTQVKTINPHGASFWTRTARLDAVENGQPKKYFLKTCHGDRGLGMVSGEFVAMSAIHALMPDLAPQPIAWGTYATLPNIHFFLSDFHAMTDELPNLTVFPSKMAELHARGIPPTGKFGFPVTTYHGNLPINHGWADSWEEYFTAITRPLFELEQVTQGANEEILSLIEPFFAKVVPRLLRPLESAGRSIKPCLIHGDLWHGNASMDADTGLPIIFDAASFYAHNEYELAVWRQEWNRIGESYILRYHENFPPSAPEENCEDRGILYATRVNLLDSILYKGQGEYRERLIASMRLLVEKFPEGLMGWEAQSQVSAP